EFVGQEHIVGPGRLLRRAIQADQLSSLIFYGPPGTGKTTLAAVIANTTSSHFITINAVLAGVKQIREAIAAAQERRNLYNQRTILFVDEVHRWNKAQQDALLPWVENGTVILIGATTENPFFEVNRPLVSRSRIFQLKSLTEEDLTAIAHRVLKDPERGYGKLNVILDDDALAHLVDVANGDARGVLNALELAVETTPKVDGVIRVTLEVAEESIQRRVVLYDKEGDYHFDTISAFIKSLRGSDADAAMYWLAKMVHAGEDPRFLFRRMVIFAGEDVGLADPNALVVTEAAAAAFDRVGLPEGRFHLAEAALYLATAPKSNSAFAFFDALAVVENEKEGEVPTPLRDASRDSEGFGHGQGYLYPHAYRDHWVAQQYMPDALLGKLFYRPGELGYEARIAEQVARRREAQLSAMLEAGGSTAPPEVLTFSPADKTRDRWLERSVSGAGERLAKLRDRVLDAAGIQRHHLVLDLNAGSGLLAWEVLRRAPEGGVWVSTADPSSGELLRQQAQGMPELLRPVVLIGELSEIPELLSLRGETDVRFDAVVGRNALTRCPDKGAMLSMILGLLQLGGTLSLAEVVPRHTQRLNQLVELESLGTELAERVRIAEEAIYTDPDDPMVNWDENDLIAGARAAGFVVETDVEREVVERRIAPADLERWFKIENANYQAGRSIYPKRDTYAGHLLKLITAGELDQIRTLYERQLKGQAVSWASSTVYLVGKHG
ncbi:MAG: AAA family ATPase, partial [Anaerolineales bacterium]|nr:AAA family ATPase [Anaerolineales bacterium]